VRLAFVLHSHMPWLRRNGTYPAGEEWLFQVWSESYLPLIEMLERLADDGLRDVLTVGITPVLAEQMDDPYLLREFHGWLGRRLLDLQHSVQRYGGWQRDGLEPVWADHWRRQSHLLDLFEQRFLSTGLTAPFAALERAGVIQVLGGPATHPYLPLFDRAELIRGQIDTGLATHDRVFGSRPRGVWTPECAYRPAGAVTDPLDPHGPAAAELPGLEDFWAEAGVDHLVLDGPTLARAAGAGDRDWAGAGGDIVPPGTPLDVLDAPVWIGDSDVAAFGRNLNVSYAVWNPFGGYPTDPWYRDFFHVDLEGGFKSWRVTSRERWDKECYEPEAAQGRALAHAGEFLDLARAHRDGRPDDGTIVAAYDTELFGHWWYEGPVWLEAVLRGAATDPRLGVTTLQTALARRPPQGRLALPESSWGMGKDHRAWVTDRTRWVWRAVRDAEARFAWLPEGPARAAAWRQLTLLQASDWPFLIARDESTQYAGERVRGHAERFAQACAGQSLSALAERDGFSAVVPARCPSVP